jgi:hypothetical protein
LNKGKIVENAKIGEKGAFKFERVLPGKYLLKV